MVLCLLPCYHFLFILLLTPAERRPKKRLLLRMGSMIAIEFRLSIFVMRIYVASKLEDAAPRLRVSSGRLMNFTGMPAKRVADRRASARRLIKDSRRDRWAESRCARLTSTAQRSLGQFSPRVAEIRLKSHRGDDNWNLNVARLPVESHRHRVMKFFVYETAPRRSKKILSAVVQKMLASDCVYHSMSISRFIHHLRTWLFSPLRRPFSASTVFALCLWEEFCFHMGSSSITLALKLNIEAQRTDEWLPASARSPLRCADAGPGGIPIALFHQMELDSVRV